MPATAAGSLALQIQGIEPFIAAALELDGELAKMLDGGDGGATRVSMLAFRASLKTDVASNYQAIGLDNGTMPLGTANKYDQFLVVPQSWTVPLQYSQLAQLMEGKDVATTSIVTDTIADIVEQVNKTSDILLQTPGDGSLASVDSIAGNVINLRSATTANIDGRGARLLQRQQTVQIMSNAYVLRGSCSIVTVYNGLGVTQQIVVDAAPGGVIAGDLVLVAGVQQGAPVFESGIPMFISTSTAGNLYGISRANPYVVASGVNLANASQVTKPVFRVVENQIKQRLGKKGLKNQFYHTHPSQLQALEELAFADSYVPLGDGKAKGYDPLFKSDSMTLNGRPIYENIHADQTRWDLMLKEVWKEIRWGSGKFWFKLRSGQMVFPLIDPETGTPTTQELMYYVVARQRFVSNPMAQGGVTGAKVPTGN
jgi:hypothetical protein